MGETTKGVASAALRAVRGAARRGCPGRRHGGRPRHRTAATRYVCMYVYVSLSLYIYIYVIIYIYRKRERDIYMYIYIYI